MGFRKRGRPGIESQVLAQVLIIAEKEDNQGQEAFVKVKLVQKEKKLLLLYVCASQFR